MVSTPLMFVWSVSAGLTQLHWGLEWGYEFQTHFIHVLLLLFSRSVTSNSLWPHGLAAVQVSLSFTISQSLLKTMSIEMVMLYNHLILCHPLLFCLQSFPASGSFAMSQLFSSGGQSIEPSALAAGLPMNIQGGFLFGLTFSHSMRITEMETFAQTLDKFHLTSAFWGEQFEGEGEKEGRKKRAEMLNNNPSCSH